MDTLLQDLRYAVRQLRARPGFTLVVTLTLALGIGANTAMLSALNAVLFRPVRAAQPDRLVWLSGTRGRSPRPHGLSYPDFADVRSQTHQLSGVLAYSHLWLSLGGGVPERIRGEAATANYFDLLGVTPALGRGFRPEEDDVNGPHRVVVLSDGFWRRRFGGDRDILGKAVTVNGLPFTVIGVAPPDFDGVEIEDDAPLALWVPMGAMPEAAPESRGFLTDRNSSGWIRTVGRLAPGASLQAAGAEMSALAAGLRPGTADPREALGLSVTPVRGGVDPTNRAEAAPVLSLLMLVPFLVLVVACANAANVLLSRGLGRRKELAVRRALGATRGRLVRQLLTESMLLALVAAAVGVLLSYLLTGVIARMGDLPPALVAAFAPDRRVLFITTLVAVGAGALFGFAPALTATRPELTPALKNESVAFGSGSERHRLRDLLIVGQVAVALVLIVTAGLFTKSLAKAVTADPGFTARHGLYLSFDLERQRYDSTRQSVFRRELLRVIAAVPGVKSVALATNVPFGGHFEGTEYGREGSSDRDVVPGFLSSVTPEYFATLGVPVLEGRGFTDRDDAATAPVVIINRHLAGQLWPGQSAIGKRLRMAGGTLWDVVGVTSTGKYANLVEDPTGEAYVPMAQRPDPALFLAVRTAGDPAGVIPSVRAAAQALDPDLPLFQLTTFEASIRGGADKQQAAAAALAVFGVLALLLTLVGIYGVTAHGVTLRTREIGIRMSLGARGRDVLRLFVGEGVRHSLAGIAVGTLVSVALSRVLAQYLFGLTATDTLSFAAGAAVVLLGVLAASGIPARRAARVDPIVALREE